MKVDEAQNVYSETRSIIKHRRPLDPHREYRSLFQTGSPALYFSQCQDSDKTWIPLLEKAYAKAHCGYDAMQWGCLSEAVEDLTGAVSLQLYTRDIMDTERFWKEELLNLNKDVLFSVRTGMNQSSYYPNGSGAPIGTPIIRTYEGHGHRLLLLRFVIQQPGSSSC